MGKHNLSPQKPDAPELRSFLDNEVQYADAAPDAIVWGDSRSKMLQARFLRDGGYDSAINVGVSGVTVENWLWELNHTGIDQTQAHVAVVEVGINSTRIALDSAGDVFNGIIQGVTKLAAKLAEGAHIYVVEIYDARPGTQYYDQAANDWINHRLETKADASGKFIFVHVDLDFATDYLNNVHLNDSGNAKVEAAIEAEMIAHGDYLPDAPEQHISIGTDGFLVG